MGIITTQGGEIYDDCTNCGGTGCEYCMEECDYCDQPMNAEFASGRPKCCALAMDRWDDRECELALLNDTYEWPYSGEAGIL